MNKQDKTPRRIQTVKTILLINSLALLAVLITSFFVENTTVSTLFKVFTILHMIIALVSLILQIQDRRTTKLTPTQEHGNDNAEIKDEWAKAVSGKQ